MVVLLKNGDPLWNMRERIGDSIGDTIGLIKLMRKLMDDNIVSISEVSASLFAVVP